MADERKAPRKWSLEEIDELLQDSGMLPREEDTISRVEEIVPAQKAAAFNQFARNDYFCRVSAAV